MTGDSNGRRTDSGRRAGAAHLARRSQNANNAAHRTPVARQPRASVQMVNVSLKNSPTATSGHVSGTPSLSWRHAASATKMAGRTHGNRGGIAATIRKRSPGRALKMNGPTSLDPDSSSSNTIWLLRKTVRSSSTKIGESASHESGAPTDPGGSHLTASSTCESPAASDAIRPAMSASPPSGAHAKAAACPGVESRAVHRGLPVMVDGDGTGRVGPLPTLRPPSSPAPERPASP